MSLTATGRHIATSVAFGLASVVVLLVLAAPVLGPKTAMPSIQVLPEEASARVGYDQVKESFGDGAPGILQVVADFADAEASYDVLSADTGIAGVMPAQPAADGSDLVILQAAPTVDPSDPELDTTLDRLRDDLPASALVGGAAVENLDLKSQLVESTPPVIAVVLALGFLLSTAAAFGVARLVFHGGMLRLTGTAAWRSPRWLTRVLPRITFSHG